MSLANRRQPNIACGRMRVREIRVVGRSEVSRRRLGKLREVYRPRAGRLWELPKAASIHLGELDVVHAEPVGVESQELHLEAVPADEAVERPVGGVLLGVGGDYGRQPLYVGPMFLGLRDMSILSGW